MYQTCNKYPLNQCCHPRVYITNLILEIGRKTTSVCHENASKLYLHFAGDAILCSSFFCILLFSGSIFLSLKDYFEFILKGNIDLCALTVYSKAIDK